ncbi:group II intron reverse transcriptase/maturase, partial [Paenibacillus larvae]
MQEIFDDLYASSQNNDKFTHLMDIVIAKNNILLAYRTIKINKGSKTPGTDRKTIAYLQQLTEEELVG